MKENPTPKEPEKKRIPITEGTKRNIYNGIGSLLQNAIEPPRYHSRLPHKQRKSRTFIAHDGTKVSFLEEPFNFESGIQGTERCMRVRTRNSDNTEKIEHIQFREVQGQGENPIIQCRYYSYDPRFDPETEPWEEVIKVLQQLTDKSELDSNETSIDTVTLEFIDTPYQFPKEPVGKFADEFDMYDFPENYTRLGQWDDFELTGSQILSERRGLEIFQFINNVTNELSS